MKKPKLLPNIAPKLSLLIVALVMPLAVVAGAASPLVASTVSACSATPNPSQGTDTQTIKVTQAGTYYLWSRILAPDTTNNSFYLQVDGGCAIDVGDSSSIPANSWTWVNYQDGSPSSVTSMNLTAGTHTIVMTGKEPNVGVDEVLFLGSSACTPTGNGQNCNTADTTPPTVSVASPTSGSTVSGTVTVTANASDNQGISSVQFKLDGQALGAADTTSPYSATWNTATATNGSHTLSAVATDTSGNTATASNVTVTVNNQAADTTAPSVPSNVKATAASSAEVDLSWNASTDNSGGSGVAKYNIYRNGGTTPYASVAAPTGSTVSYKDVAVSASTTYSYTVSAVDAAGNESAKSTPAASVTTPAAADKTAPSVPTGLKSTGATSTTISLSWSPSTDNTGGSGVAGYHVYRNGSLAGSSTGTTFTDTGLAPSTSYTYTVSAYDNAANGSVASAAITASTTAASGTVQGISWNASTMTLSWQSFPGAASYTVALVRNPTTTRNTYYTWLNTNATHHVTSTSCVVPSGCGITLPTNQPLQSGEKINFNVRPLGSSGNDLANWANEITVTWPSTASPTPPPTKHPWWQIWK